MKASSVFKREALTCTAENEEYRCGSACQTTCSNLVQPCPIVNIRCNDACYCVNGYARNGNDSSKCIPISRCPVSASGVTGIIRGG